MHTAGRMYRKDRNDVHGRYSKISIHTAGRVHRKVGNDAHGQPCAAFPIFVCTRPCAILFTASRVHLPLNTDGCWAVNNIANQLSPCLSTYYPTTAFLLCCFCFASLNLKYVILGIFSLTSPNQNIGVCVLSIPGGVDASGRI